MAPEPLARLRERSQGSRNVNVVEAPYHATPVAADSCNRVIMANLWTELPDPIATLHEAARLLRENGRLILIDWHAGSECAEAPAQRIGFHEMVRLLEKNMWDIHRHGDIGACSYFLEAAVSDESVQS
jgi:ubiquinone/menaquinone biosynthesis C-methylase UbiE